MQSLKKLSEIKQSWLDATLPEDPEKAAEFRKRCEEALTRIDEIIARRTNPNRNYRALPKKKQRELGLIPSVEDELEIQKTFRDAMKWKCKQQNIKPAEAPATT